MRGLLHLFWVDSWICKGLYAEPEADIVYWNSEVLECGMAEEEPEDIEYVMSIVGESVWVDDCVEVYCE